MPRYLPRALREKRGQGSRRPDTDRPRDATTITKPLGRTSTARAETRRSGDRLPPSQRTAETTRGSVVDLTDDLPVDTSPTDDGDKPARRRPSPRPHADDTNDSDGTSRTRATKTVAKAPAKPTKRLGGERRNGATVRLRSNGKVKKVPRGRRDPQGNDAVVVRRRLTTLAMVLVVLAAVSSAAGGTAWYFYDQAKAVAKAREEAKAAAVIAAKAVFSYDYRSFDQSVNNGKQFVTGSFAKEYVKTTSDLKATAIKEQAVVWSDVAAVSVTSATRDKVDVLLYVNQYRKNVNITGQKVDQNRVVLTMVRTGNEWKVAAASAI